MVSQGLLGFRCVGHTGVSGPQLARESIKAGTGGKIVAICAYAG